MIRSRIQESRRRAGIAVWLAVSAGIAVSGCKKPPSSSTSSSPTASAAAEKESASDPCSTYATRLCDKAGSDSPNCQAITTATGLMPPAACAAGLKDIDYTVKKLATARKGCDELIQKLCEAVGPNTQTCQLVATETKKFSADRCKQMMEHLPEVVSELQQMERANQPLSTELQALIAAKSPASFGPADAKVQIVEFSDFQCPYCSQAASVVHEIRKKYGDRVRFTFRQFPLPMHPNAREAAEAALAAGEQGKFWEFHDRLFKDQGHLDRASLEEHAKQSGVNMAAFKKSLDDHKFAPVVDSDVKLGEKVNVQGTPSMFVNGTRVQNPTNFEAIAELIEAALKGKAPG